MGLNVTPRIEPEPAAKNRTASMAPQKAELSEQADKRGVVLDTSGNLEVRLAAT